MILDPRLQSLQASFAPCPITRINDHFLDKWGIELWIKRDDLLHSIISGNKWRKLKYILNHALIKGSSCMLSMGGAYSNHLHALAFAGQCLNLKTAAYIRGERPTVFNPTLTDLCHWGMDLRFISRSEYRQLRQFKAFDSLPDLKTGEYWLPEGGAINLALQGVAESIAEITIPYDVLAVACGTGTTLAGMIAAAPTHCQILGIAALQAGYMHSDVQQLLTTQHIIRNNWHINLDYHCGGFAKTHPELLAFMQNFEALHAIPLDPVYTGKLLFGIYDLIKQGYFTAGQRVMLIHTGGLQGKRKFC
ncbi:pyridoxal-phosphate dependent enzyme [Methylomonas sp. AM2-LC]|uniref:1-aminocyclopropane-1-carboxylate deaminase/D-cysteine desulfhydrase n=1 Tax=Methylomonas sp. AM2-LC TaxID=3153301 RepID=UPI0032646516